MKKKDNYYNCVVVSFDIPFEFNELCTVRLKGLFSVCKFLETVDFHKVGVDVISPTGYKFSGYELFRIWSER